MQLSIIFLSTSHTSANGQVETDETENRNGTRKAESWNGKRKRKAESGNEKAGNWKWSSGLKIISGDSEHSSLGLWTSYV